MAGPVISPLVADQYGHGEFLERKGLGSMIEPTVPSVSECQVAIERGLRLHREVHGDRHPDAEGGWGC